MAEMPAPSELRELSSRLPLIFFQSMKGCFGYVHEMKAVVGEPAAGIAIETPKNFVAVYF